ncbi:MAG: DUF3828 domain-containing protein [Chloroflexi bacterium]|nr:DUF3828 domain-containing protein [Chloroflexota bacterium]
MRRIPWLVLVLGVLFVLVVAGLGAVRAAATRASALAGLSPAEITERFYAWYLTYGQESPRPGASSVLADRAYQHSPYVTRRLVQELNALMDSGARLAFEPCLCAQDRPARLEVAHEMITGDRASVVVTLIWAGNPMGTGFEVNLRRVGPTWRIDHIDCANAWQEPLRPQSVVRSFYDLYLQARRRSNPLTDGRYADMPFLAPEWVQAVEQKMAVADRDPTDPFLCARIVPSAVRVGKVTALRERAAVAVELVWNEGTAFETTRDLEVELRFEEQAWLIRDIWCFPGQIPGVEAFPEKYGDPLTPFPE